MKKFYSALALAIAVAFSASATPVAMKSAQDARLVQRSASQELNIEMAPSVGMQKVGAHRARPTNMSELVGEYSMNFINGATGEEVTDVLAVIEQVGTTDSVTLTGWWYSNPMKGIVDFEKGTIKFPAKQKLVFNKNKGEWIVLNNYTVNYDKAQGKPAIIDQNMRDLDFTIEDDGSILPAVYTIDTPAGKKEYDFYYVAAQTLGSTFDDKAYAWRARMELAPKVWQEVSMDSWTTVGQGTFEDAWIRTAFTNPSAFPNLDVTVQKCDTLPSTYRILNPYATVNEKWFNVDNLADCKNISPVGGQIVFDLAHPEFVMIQAGPYSGFRNDAGFGFGLLYCYNSEYVMFNSGQYELEELIESMPVVSTYNAETGLVDIKNAVFGYGTDIMAADGWVNKDKTKVDMTGSLLMPEVGALDNVIVDSNNAPAVYYNLQGVQVEKPAAGIFIRKQGKQVSKVYVR